MRFFISDIETCDVEGSSAVDCPEDTHCCKQSACDLIFKTTPSPNKRCCSETERIQDPLPKDCRVCTTCCDDLERDIIPIPSHCSKCPKCKDGKWKHVAK